MEHYYRVSSDSSELSQEYHMSESSTESLMSIMFTRNYQPFLQNVGYIILGIELISSSITIGLLLRHLLPLESITERVGLVMIQSTWLPLFIAGLRILYSTIGMLGLYMSSYKLTGILLVLMVFEIAGTLGLLILSAITSHFLLIWMTAITVLLDVYFLAMFYRYFRIYRKEKYVLLS
ncbi:hypothetical protein K7432_011623 [Basidiobolus ranarum]|uniref:Uncharacterized protein n=1 Tax=Basidiobolus ranarum TaxID=34480 RepID=A0ABR2VTJ3_9FUNG